MKMITIIIILFLLTSALLLTSCQEEELYGSDIIFKADVCNTNGTYCHYIVTDADQVNLTFLVNDTFNYSVDMG